MLPTRRGAAAIEHLASYVSVLLHLRPCPVLVGLGVDARACWCLCLVFSMLCVCARVCACVLVLRCDPSGFLLGAAFLAVLGALGPSS